MLGAGHFRRIDLKRPDFKMTDVDLNGDLEDSAVSENGEGDVLDDQLGSDSDTAWPNETPAKSTQSKKKSLKSTKKESPNKAVKKSPKATKKGRAASGAPTKSKKGQKYCIGCKKYFPPGDFPLSKGLCAADAKVWRNIANQAVSQDDKEYLADTRRDEKKFQRMLANYHTRCVLPDGKRNRRLGFSLLKFKEEVLQEQSLITQGRYQMMTEKQYEIFAAKPENGGIDVDIARGAMEEMAK